MPASLADQMLNLFVKQSPVSVMMRATLENVLSDERLNRLFEEHAHRQYCRELTFATCAGLMTQVVTRTRKSLHAAYQAQRQEIPVSVTAVYDKLNGMEPQICEALIQETSLGMREMIDFLKPRGTSPIPRYDVRLVDGNHLSGTDKRIKELRGQNAAALPGQSIAILDPKRQLVEAVVTCEDGHTNERKLIPALLEHVRPRQCWIADSLFCTLAYLFGVRTARGHFVVRQHSQLQGELTGQCRKIGRVDTGMVHEQSMIIRHKGEPMTVRRITVRRDTPTQKGKNEVHILTSLPASIDAIKVAQAYRERWKIETAFQDLTTNLRCEINTLGYPDAALFGFSIAIVMYNVLSVVQSALLAAAKKKPERNLSLYAITNEISEVWHGMLLALPKEVWQQYASLSPRQLAMQLQQIAAHAKIEMLITYKWSQKKKRTKPTKGKRGDHVATQRIIDQRTHQ